MSSVNCATVTIEYGGCMNKGKIRAHMETMRDIHQRISEIADEDPLEALFILKNLKVEEGINEKPLMAKILLKLAEKLDFAVRQNHREKAKIIRSLLIKMIEELEVKEIYEIVNLDFEKNSQGGDDFNEELIDDTPLEECMAIFKGMKP